MIAGFIYKNFHHADNAEQFYHWYLQLKCWMQQSILEFSRAKFYLEAGHLKRLNQYLLEQGTSFNNLIYSYRNPSSFNTVCPTSQPESVMIHLQKINCTNTGTGILFLEAFIKPLLFFIRSYED